MRDTYFREIKKPGKKYKYAEHLEFLSRSEKKVEEQSPTPEEVEPPAKKKQIRRP